MGGLAPTEEKRQSHRSPCRPSGEKYRLLSRTPKSSEVQSSRNGPPAWGSRVRERWLVGGPRFRDRRKRGRQPLEELSKLQALQFQWLGEHELHPDIPVYVFYAHSISSDETV